MMLSIQNWKESELEGDAGAHGQHTVAENHSNTIVTEDVLSLCFPDFAALNNTVASIDHPVSGARGIVTTENSYRQCSTLSEEAKSDSHEVCLESTPSVSLPTVAELDLRIRENGWA
jgi:hypothetical protein